MTQEKTPKPNPGSQILQKNLLITMAFWSGASIMLIELSANRILAPWFGNTLFTWTGLIGVILCAMSGGYYFGGWLADKKPNFAILGHLMVAASALTFLIPILSPSLTDLFSEETNIILGPVVASLLLFALPGFLLGSVSPYAIRLISLLSNDKQVGVSAGMIGMFSTLGSVVGTFCAGFVLIPNMGIRTIFILVGLILAILSALAYFLFLSPKRNGTIALGAVCLMTVVLIIGTYISTPAREPDVVYDQTTFYHRIRVFEQDVDNLGILRTLMLDTTPEGAQYMETGASSIPYQNYWELSTLYCPDLQRALFLGAGAFMMPEALCDAFPEAEIDVVDIDPQVVEVGRQFFRVNDYPRLKAVPQDARLFLNSSSEKYDLIFGDAYNGLRAIPAHLVTAEFFQLVKDSLKGDGVYMMNIISAYEGKNAGLFKAVMKTLSGEFANFHIFTIDPYKPRIAQNIIIVASDRQLPSVVEESAPGINNGRMEYLLKTYIPPEKYDFSDAPTLTDNYNPVDYIIARNLLNQ